MPSDGADAFEKLSGNPEAFMRVVDDGLLPTVHRCPSGASDLTLTRELSTLAKSNRFDPIGFVVAAIGEDRGRFDAWVNDA